MKLTYRGHTYDYNFAKSPSRPFQQIRQSGSAYELCYRGVKYRVDPNAKAAKFDLPATYQLIYRGMSYLVNRNTRKVTTTN